MTSRSVKRINDVRMLRSVQFAEDAGPLAHPIRPDSYIKMDNFYTATVYAKVMPQNYSIRLFILAWGKQQ